MYYTQAQKENDHEYLLLHKYTNTNPVICIDREIFLITVIHDNIIVCRVPLFSSDFCIFPEIRQK